MSEEAHKKFKTAMFDQVVASHRRLGVFLGQGESNYISYLVAMEALLLLEKIRLLDPEQYGKAMADHGRADDMVKRGWCSGIGCYDTLSNPFERCEFDPQIQPFLDKWCPTCAAAIVKENECDDQELSEHEKEIFAEMEKELAEEQEKG